MRPLSRKRSLRVAAAGLSLAMAAAFAPGVFPTIEPEVAHAAPGAPAAAQDQAIDADMIASGRVTKAANLTDAHGVGKGLISGHVYLTSPNGNPGATYDNGNVKMDGITVYAQFRDKDGSYSPIFSAKTHTLPDVVGGNGGKGTYAFGTGKKGISWTDKLGKEHTWAARTDQRHRIWVEPFTNDRGNRVEMFRQANGFVPGSFNGLVDYPLGSFAVADGNIQLTAAFLREIPPSHESSYMAAKGDKLVEDPKGPIPNASTQLATNNAISGRVWLETGYADGGIIASGPLMNEYTDVAADGYTVYASTLTKDGAAANAKLHETYKNDPNKLAEETKKMLEDHPEYIAKTVYGKTDAKGNYSLRFGDYTDKNQTREDILNPNHVFVWVENKDGVVQSGYTGFHTPVFQRFDAGGNFRPSAIPAENQTITARVEDQGKPRYGKPVNSIYNMNYAVMTYTPVSITADYNATDKPAAPGTTVTPEFNGDLSSLPSRIEWRDANGKVLKTCKLDQSKSIKSQVSACTFDIPADANKGDFYNVVVVSGDNDVAAWSVLVTDKNSDSFEPKYEDKLVVPGEETKSTPTFTDKDGKDVKAPEGSKFSIPEDFTAPEGYEVKIDENTGEITVTFPDGSKLNKDTVEEFDVPVTVTYPDGSKDDAKAKFKLDTDGDGKPDTEDEDDDNDGIPDGEDDNPKVPNQSTVYKPAYEDKLVVPGEETKSTPTFTDKDGKDTKAPEGSKFSIPEDFKAPEGYEVKIDENTGEITVTFPDKSKLNKDTVEEFDVPVTVTYPDGSTDKTDANFKLDTDGDGKPDTEDEDDDNDGIPDEDDSNPKVPNANDHFEPGYEDGSGKPGEDVTVPAPGFKDKDGNPAEAPEGTKFTPGEGAPDGVKVDEKTGEITVPVPEDAKPGDKITVPVDVTYPDGSKDTVDVTVTVEEPDAPVEKDNEKFEPGYEDGSGKPGEDVTVPAPGFKDKDGNKVTVPEGTKFTTDKDGVEVAEDGSLKVQIPADAKPGDKITVPVDVTYPDGSKDTVDVTVTVTDPDSKPEWGDGEGEPGDTVTVPYGGGDVPEGSTPEVEGPGKAEIDEDGNLVVDIDEDAKLGDEIVIEVKDPEGSTIDESTVTVIEPPAPAEKDADTYEPGYEDGSGKPGDDVTIDAPGFKDKDGNPTEAPEGTKFTPGEGAPDGVKVDEKTGEITVPVPEDAKPGDKITVPVDVTYPDGSKDTVDVTVTVEEPEAPAEKPDWKDDKGKPGDKVEIPNTGGPVEDGTTVETEGPGKTEIDEDGKIRVDIDKDAKPGDKIKVVVKDKDGKVIDEVTVTVEKPGGKKPEVPAPSEKPDWNDNHVKPGDKVEIPNEGGPVEDGTTVEVEGPGKAEIDKDGNIRVGIDKDAKPGDKIKVVVKDKDGKVIDEVNVHVKDPNKSDAENYQPKWNDSTIKPGDTITLPNIGDKLPNGTTLEIKGKDLPKGWGVQIDKNGAIKVTAPSWAKPGDTVKIPVHITYPDGSTEVVYFTVTVTGDADKGGSNDKGGPLPRTGVEVGAALAAASALIAGGIALIARSRRRNN